ncbi:hypothetical protein JCM4814A_53060 [Streptomyces phaeofaciens JCM 4814]|uniref:Uncharacterized protein n=1 Tax=Streptomyces phaeofaciens TaxID=68254 RepID=A0A918HNI5_9ACTN|nr:hypothetical protein GCM10010226_68670 [Streptomyces phaeofaciens]
MRFPLPGPPARVSPEHVRPCRLGAARLLTPLPACRTGRKPPVVHTPAEAAVHGYAWATRVLALASPYAFTLINGGGRARAAGSQDTRKQAEVPVSAH